MDIYILDRFGSYPPIFEAIDGSLVQPAPVIQPIQEQMNCNFLT